MRSSLASSGNGTDAEADVPSPVLPAGTPRRDPGRRGPGRGHPPPGPAPAVNRDPSEGGLGLYLIAELATDHGWYVTAGAKHVWAVLAP